MTKSPLNKTSLLPEVRRVAQSAANEVMHIYQSSFKVSYKKDKSPLTEADLVSHRVVEKGLRQLTPEIPILSEESAPCELCTKETLEMLLACGSP